MEALIEAKEPLFPREIALAIQEKKITTRVNCRRLLKEGLIHQPLPGLYSAVTKLTYGSASVDKEHPPRLQNFVVEFGCQISASIPDFVRQFGSIGMKILFGRRHQRVTCYLSCQEGMDLNSFVLALETCKYVVASKLGVFPTDDSLKVDRAELLQDYQKIRMEGINCLTVESFTGIFEKMYNKENGLRSEVRAYHTSVEAIYALLKGGVVAYNNVQLGFSILDRLEELLRIIVVQAEGIQNIQRMIFCFLERMDERDKTKASNERSERNPLKPIESSFSPRASDVRPHCPECTSQRVWKAGDRKAAHYHVKGYRYRDCRHRSSQDHSNEPGYVKEAHVSHLTTLVDRFLSTLDNVKTWNHLRNLVGEAELRRHLSNIIEYTFYFHKDQVSEQEVENLMRLLEGE